MRAVVGLVVALGACGGAAVSGDGLATVVLVVDGDTIDVEISGRTERVRLIGIDTPELHVEDGPPECWAVDAAGLTAELVPVGTDVRLVRDVVPRDDYGRLLAYVYRAADGTFVNEALLLAGAARPLSIPPNDTYAGRFVDAVTAAERDELGLWSACRG